jgi:type IV secretory pathway VirB10-like protein
MTDVPTPADETALASEDAEPVVAKTPASLSPVVTLTGFVVAAVALFLVLNGRRTEHADPSAIPTGIQAQDAAWAPPPPLQLPATPISAAGPAPFSDLPAQVLMPPPAAIPPPPASATYIAPAAGALGRADASQRLRAPALVVDLGGAQRETVLAQAGPAAAGAIGASLPANAQAQRPQLSDSEQFAKRVGDEEPERARATPMRSVRATAPQGTIIPGVLETAINSDLPGFTRAVVSRDVLSFDGKAVLIPRGSRLIGQYKSAVALGQSRAFIIWTRVIRPDGVSIQIGSPGTDELGRGGLTGEVDQHFFRRFSGSILLSVLNAGVASLGRTPSTQISIGSPGAASGLANSALQGDNIPPTIKVAQGEAINIFVARDLDFSAVEAVK